MEVSSYFVQHEVKLYCLLLMFLHIFMPLVSIVFDSTSSAQKSHFSLGAQGDLDFIRLSIFSSLPSNYSRSSLDLL